MTEPEQMYLISEKELRDYGWIVSCSGYKVRERLEREIRSRPVSSSASEPAPNLSCLGNYERDPCLIPACPIKVKCREYTKLRQQEEKT